MEKRHAGSCYRCNHCGRFVPREKLEERGYLCPGCNARVFLKPRPEVIRVVKAR